MRWFSWVLGNCIAVGQWAQKFLPNLPPPTSLRGRDAELEGGPVLRAADDVCAAKEPVAQGGDAHPLQPAQMPAEQRRKVVSKDTERECGLGGEELRAAQARQPEAVPQLFDHAFDAGAPVVVAPHRQRAHARGQVGEQRLVFVAGALQEALAAAAFVLDASAQEHEPARARGVFAFVDEVGEFHPGHLARLPAGFPFDEPLHAHAQVGDDRGGGGDKRGKAEGRADVAQALAFEQAQPRVVVEAAVGPDQPQTQGGAAGCSGARG